MPALLPARLSCVLGSLVDPSRKGCGTTERESNSSARLVAPCRYGCIVFERGDITLAEHWRLKRHSLSAIQKQAILHQVAALRPIDRDR